MNILFFLIPKADVEYITDDFTIRQALEKMDFHHFSAIPILNDEGEYIATISEGDLLWHLKNNELDIKKCEQQNITEVKIRRKINSISVHKEMNDLVNLIIGQNFVPVVDDRDKFIGIITRKAVIKYLQSEIKKKL